MNIQISNDRKVLRVVAFPESGELTMQEAISLVRDLIDATTQCGYEVKMTVDVPRHKPTVDQIRTAVHRVGHLRKSLENNVPWNDTKVNTELVMRVLEACL